MRLAIIAGDGIGPEVIAEALKVLDVVVPGVEKTEYDLGAGATTAPGRSCRIGAARAQAHDAILLGAIGDPSVPSGVLERGLLLRSVSSWITTSTCARRSCTRVSPARCRATRISTSWSCGRAPRVRTPAPAARSASARRTRWRPRSATTPASASSGWCATPSPPRRPAASTSPWCTRTMC